MTFATAENLIATLRSLGLLPPDRLAELPHLQQARAGDALGLARTLVQRGQLTVYQINEILAGRGRELVFGPYHVLDRLGQGGLSQVFKARHVELKMTVALKVIKPEVLSNVEGRQQFLQEMEAMARLDHPNVVQFCDADRVGDTCYFAMEYVEGVDLGKHVRLVGPLPVREACDYVRQAALGLQHAHERNLVHRDVKPVNLFLTQVPIASRAGGGRPGAALTGSKSGRRRSLIKILDWGLAALRVPGGAGAAVTDNVARSIVGTADYLSPEQARDANAVDIRGDLYSLGCSFYYLLTGRPPFPEGTLMQKILQHQQAEPAPIEALRSDVPAAVAEVLRRLLHKRPQDRFQTPAALALALLPSARGDAPEATTRSARPYPSALSARRDDTPLPATLGNDTAAGETERLPRAGRARGGEPGNDTAFP